MENEEFLKCPGNILVDNNSAHISGLEANILSKGIFYRISKAAILLCTSRKMSSRNEDDSGLGTLGDYVATKKNSIMTSLSAFSNFRRS